MLDRDDCIEEFIKRFGLGWFGQLAYSQGCSDLKTPKCTKYATFWGDFFNFLWEKKRKKKDENIVASALKSCIEKR